MAQGIARPDLNKAIETDGNLEKVQHNAEDMYGVLTELLDEIRKLRIAFYIVHGIND